MDSINSNYKSANMKAWDNYTPEDQVNFSKAALAYLTSTIEIWKTEEKHKKMTALANFAFKWNSNGGPKALIKVLQTEISELNRSIKRKQSIGRSFEAQTAELVTLKEELARLQDMDNN